ncbi:isoaspartyl peptidase/L-asparaginase [Fulvivirga sp. M361]|uniref:isoaspartyl peptidase/L-asparaginase family protein n=1 Tax=Fulvivirga sp. M361 TaxID=2594266 RepID=UPI00117AA725|nr:isoaspartyl peptidase/L-asparaginase [Fulvivirga sp. M361]TRX58219.1 isoaspartyl peptidase/L-asparaginase [Fulvivirga sp. M361]
MKAYGIAIHGGAGTVSRAKMTKWKAEAYKETLKRAYSMAYQTLHKGGSSIDAVIEAIVILEDSYLFNAGKGSVYTHLGTHEMDAAVMEGKKLKAGAVASVGYVKNPIKLAHTVMTKTKHVLISGEQATEFAKDHNLEIESKEYFYDEFRYKQWQKALMNDKVQLDHDEDGQKFGTVGAVALDKKGNLASGTSTGGMVNKKYGRIGDTPLIGIGTYANNDSCAISCTGHGEFFIRAAVAYDISARMMYNKQSLQEASNEVIHKELPALGGRGGLIGIDKHGHIVMPFNTKGMYRGLKSSKNEEFVGIFE